MEVYYWAVRVLIADDDPVTLRLVSHVLLEFGYDVTTASDGLEARRKFLSDRFPLVVTNWEMPGLTGLEFCQQIRSANLPNYTYIIFLTAWHEKPRLVAALSSGADDYIAKPFDPGELVARLRAAERILNLESQLLGLNQKLREMNFRLRKMSRLDPLMEIGNRLAFEEEISDFHDRAVQNGYRYGVVMCDVDCFKEYNDAFGHQSGDEVLRQVAAEIRATIRSGDAAFRYGGEEILILLAEQDLSRTGAAAERIRRRVEQLQFPSGHLGEVHRITISCGVASYPENFDPARGWKALLESADLALYRAKASGRNRVVVATPGSGHSLVGPSLAIPESIPSEQAKEVSATVRAQSDLIDDH